MDTNQLFQSHPNLLSSMNKEAIYQMKKRILQKLQYQLMIPTRYEFAIYYSHHLQFTIKQKSLLLFFILLSFFDFNLNYESMSRVAASAVYLVLQVFFLLFSLLPFFLTASSFSFSFFCSCS